MIVLTPKEMVKLDKRTIKEGFPSILLMETAGRGLADIIKVNFNNKKDILIFSGPGNNGGDGMVLGRLLDICNYNVKIIVVGEEKKLSQDALTNFKICKLRNIDIDFIPQDIDLNFVRETIRKYDVIVDAMLGTGLSGRLRSPYLELVKMINESNKNIISVDIPTGIEGKTGKVMGEAIKADITVTMAFSKIGHHVYPGRSYTGKLKIIDLGMPDSIINDYKYNHFVLGKYEAKTLLPKRSITGHKGSFGKVLVIGGKEGYEGAPALTGESALRTGSGLVKLLVPKNIRNTVSTYCKELITEKLEMDILKNEINKYDIIALGPGLGQGEIQKEIVSFVLNKSNVPLVIDADGLNNLNLEDLKYNQENIVLTPHPGEFSKLTNKPISEIQNNRIKYAQEFAKKYKITLVLKGADTIIALSNGDIFINKTGNNGMATAGSGDVLTGIISSLSGQGLNIRNSAILGVYLHGLAGDLEANKHGNYSLIAQDIINKISPAISYIKRGGLYENS